MKLKDFKNLEPGNKVILNNGREAQVKSIFKSITGKLWAQMFYTDTLREITKTHRQIREKVKE